MNPSPLKKYVTWSPIPKGDNTTSGASHEANSEWKSYHSNVFYLTPAHPPKSPQIQMLPRSHYSCPLAIPLAQPITWLSQYPWLSAFNIYTSRPIVFFPGFPWPIGSEARCRSLLTAMHLIRSPDHLSVSRTPSGSTFFADETIVLA